MLNFILSIYTYLCLHVSAGAYGVQKWLSGPLGVRVTGGSELPYVNAGNQIWVLSKRSMSFYPLSYLSH